ncbi:MAG: hypothetical protein AB7G75_22485 [Candidatus Binatia bacterium]
MSEVTLFAFGLVVTLMWAAAALAPFLYAASKAELDWRARKRRNNPQDPLASTQQHRQAAADLPNQP